MDDFIKTSFVSLVNKFSITRKIKREPSGESVTRTQQEWQFIKYGYAQFFHEHPVKMRPDDEINCFRIQKVDETNQF